MVIGEVTRGRGRVRLAGLGSAPSEVLSDAELSAFREELKTLITQGDDAIYTAKNEVTTDGFFGLLGDTLENILTLGALSKLKTQLRERVDDAVYSWEQSKKTLWAVQGSGMVAGHRVTRPEGATLLRLIGSHMSQMRGAVELVNEYTGGKILARAVRDAIGTVLMKIADVLKAIGDAIIALAKGITGAANGLGTFLGWLPVIVVAAIVVPPVLRSISAYRKGGANAAFDTMAEQIESGRAAAVRGVKSAYEAGTRLYAARRG